MVTCDYCGERVVDTPPTSIALSVGMDRFDFHPECAPAFVTQAAQTVKGKRPPPPPPIGGPSVPSN